MKYQAASMKTKRALADSLKKLMRAKPFSKITVTEIVNECGVNRKTFYYHFEDIYSLLRWIFEEEAVGIIKRFDLIHDYEEAMDFVSNYIDENRDLLRNAYDAFGSVELGRFFRMSFIGITASLIESVEQSMRRRLPDNVREYLCEFLTEAAAGMLLSNISGHMSFDRINIVKPVRSIVRASIVGVLTEQGIPYDPEADGQSHTQSVKNV